MSSSLGKRVITTVVGIPAVIVLLIFLPEYNYLGFSLLTFVAVIIGSYEMERMLFKKIDYLFLLPLLFPLTTYIELLFDTKIMLSDFVFPFLIMAIFALEIIKGAFDNFENSIHRLSKKLLLMIYPGFFASFIIKILAISSKAGLLLLYMLILVFANDIFAYVFGMLFGRKTKGILKASPNKSLVGFIGGLLSCIGFSFLFAYLTKIQISYYGVIILGILVSISANIGDLFESVLKRSAGVKDSGNIIPGRGGVLDSIDSIISSVPLFFLVLKIFL